MEDGRYFVTLHLAGAIPPAGQERIHRIAEDLAKIPKSEAASRLQVHRRVFAEMEAWLDRAAHVTYLHRPEVASMVIEAIRHRETSMWQMFEFVVMPTHVHFFFSLRRSGLQEAMEDFKRWTGHRAARLISLERGRFWQDEWFDHWSRSDEEDERIVEYIRRNPVKAQLVESYDRWPYGSWSPADAPK